MSLLREGVEERAVLEVVHIEARGGGEGGDSGEKREVSMGKSDGGTRIERFSLNLELVVLYSLEGRGLGE